MAQMNRLSCRREYKKYMAKHQEEVDLYRRVARRIALHERQLADAKRIDAVAVRYAERALDYSKRWADSVEPHRFIDLKTWINIWCFLDLP